MRCFKELRAEGLKYNSVVTFCLHMPAPQPVMPSWRILAFASSAAADFWLGYRVSRGLKVVDKGTWSSLMADASVPDAERSALLICSWGSFP